MASPDSIACADLHIVLFPAGAFPIAKQFWQHSGLGISSRRAEYCLSMLPDDLPLDKTPSPTGSFGRVPFKASHNRHYSAKGINLVRSPSLQTGPPSPQDTHSESMKADQSVYLEERYGRNLSLSFAPAAKRALRRRIAGVLVHDTPQCSIGEPAAGGKDAEIGPSTRGVASVTEDDVFLYPTGMSAIWDAHQLALSVRPPAKSVCFG
jgi:cystathionine gamma-synthase